MKPQFLTVLIFFFFTFSLCAQITEGTIIYEVKINLHQLLPEDMEGMKESIPEFQDLKKELVFTRDQSLFVDYEEEVGRGRGSWFRMGAREIHHHNLPENKYTVQRGLMNDDYLIEEDVERHPWTLTGRSEMIAGKICQLAYRVDDRDSSMIEVWFTPEIPLSIGPENYFGLPGAVLMAVINYNEKIYIATEIINHAVSDSRVQVPTRGKRVSRKEYEEISEKMMEEFRSRAGGGKRR